MLNNGRAAETGTHSLLSGAGSEFERLVHEFGGDTEQMDEDQAEVNRAVHRRERRWITAETAGCERLCLVS
jgi:hypothetical protein